MVHRPSHVTWILSAIVATAAMQPLSAQTAAEPVAPQRSVNFAQLPIQFESRPAGHAGEYVAFGPRFAWVVAPTSATLHLADLAARGTRPVTIHFDGANRHAIASALDPLPGVTNHLIGNDPSRWTVGARGYGRILYRSAYRGVDVVFYGNQRQIEFDFVVAPGANAGAIAMRIDGAKRIAIDDAGDLIISTDHGNLVQHRPVIYQEQDGVRQPVQGAFRLDRRGRVRFRLGSYDRRRPLTIDPVLTYSTYLGGSNGDSAQGVAVDAEGNIYVAGQTASPDFPLMNPAQDTRGASTDAFVAKLNSAGNQLIYATYLGGNSEDAATDIAVDAQGNAYISGYTLSSDFPRVAAAQQGWGGSYDGFIAKLTSSGTVAYSTYLGGQSEDRAAGVAVDAEGRAWVTGTTSSANFPVRDALQSRLNGGAVWKSMNGGASIVPLDLGLRTILVGPLAIDTTDPRVIFAGTDADGVFKSSDEGATWTQSLVVPPSYWVTSIVVDPVSRAVYAAIRQVVVRSDDGGETWTGIAAFNNEVVSLVLDPSSPNTLYAMGYDGLWKRANGITTKLSLAGAVFSLAVSRSAPATMYAGTAQGIAKTTDGGTTWTNVSFHNGGPRREVRSLAVDPANAAIVYAASQDGLYTSTSGGASWSGPIGFGTRAVAIAPTDPRTVYAGGPYDGIIVSHDAGATWAVARAVPSVYALAIDPSNADTIYVSVVSAFPAQDAFATRLSADGSSIEYSTLIGGLGFESGKGIAVDAAGNAYVVGTTNSPEFPIRAAAQPGHAGFVDAFVVKLAAKGTLAYSTFLGGSGDESGGSIAVDAHGQAHVSGTTTSNDFPVVHAYQPARAGSTDRFVTTVSADGTSFVYSTYLGGAGSESQSGKIGVDADGGAYVTGATQSADFPIVRAAVPSSYGGGLQTEGFVAKLSADGLLQWSTFLGGADNDYPNSLAVEATGAVTIAGRTSSTNFPTVNAYQPGNHGLDDAFIARIDPDVPDPSAPVTSIALSGVSGLAGWYRSQVTATLNAADAAGESGVAFVDYNINNSWFQRYREPINISIPGETSISARATDNSGHVESPATTWTVKLDAVAPVLDVSPPVDADYVRTDSPIVAFSAADSVSGLATGSPAGTFDGSPVTSGQTLDLLQLRLGTHTIVVNASDAAGNITQRVVTMNVVATLSGLVAAVNTFAAQGTISASAQNSLLTDLADAQKAFDRGNFAAARSRLNDFISHCEAKSGKSIAAPVAALLAGDAQFVLAGL